VDDRIELIVAEPNRKPGGTSIAIAASFVLHALILVLFLRGYRPAASVETRDTPMVRYVELIRNNPREFVEAPGPKTDRAPINAPWSDANRRASGPNPTGDRPTKRPGDGTGLYTPPVPEMRRGTPAPQQQAQAAAPAQAPAATAADSSSRIPPLRTSEASSLASTGINWGSAIREAAKVASISGQNMDLSGVAGSGGEQGTFEQGPLSFETQWYDWGEYAQSMVSRIRINWYGQMPPLIRTGLKGVVTIRFTIQRDGRITDVTLLESSTAPPYDFAARKAIELSTPLNPLPKDFPNANERVVARFYYNSKPPVE
jgi:TonB family protein